jgi:hypothetical protein
MGDHGGKRPALLWALVGLLLVQAVGGIAGGVALVAAPDGSVLKMSTSLLDGSPFPDYLVPGLVLLLVLGVLPLAAAVLLMVRPAIGWYAAFVVGCGLVIWLAVELTIIPFTVWHVAFGVVAVLIIATSLAPSVRRSCGVVGSESALG